MPPINTWRGCVAPHHRARAEAGWPCPSPVVSSQFAGRTACRTTAGGRRSGSRAPRPVPRAIRESNTSSNPGSSSPLRRSQPHSKTWCGRARIKAARGGVFAPPSRRIATLDDASKPRPLSAAGSPRPSGPRECFSSWPNGGLGGGGVNKSGGCDRPRPSPVGRFDAADRTRRPDIRAQPLAREVAPDHAIRTPRTSAPPHDHRTPGQAAAPAVLAGPVPASHRYRFRDQVVPAGVDPPEPRKAPQPGPGSAPCPGDRGWAATQSNALDPVAGDDQEAIGPPGRRCRGPCPGVSRARPDSTSVSRDLNAPVPLRAGLDVVPNPPLPDCKSNAGNRTRARCGATRCASSCLHVSAEKKNTFVDQSIPNRYDQKGR